MIYKEKELQMEIIFSGSESVLATFWYTGICFLLMPGEPSGLKFSSNKSLISLFSATDFIKFVLRKLSWVATEAIVCSNAALVCGSSGFRVINFPTLK